MYIVNKGHSHLLPLSSPVHRGLFVCVHSVYGSSVGLHQQHHKYMQNECTALLLHHSCALIRL